jgi:hypothetical protein
MDIAKRLAQSLCADYEIICIHAVFSFYRNKSWPPVYLKRYSSRSVA